MTKAARYRLNFTGALGDIVAMTAMVRDFSRSNPDIGVEVRTPFPDVFLWNPWLTNWKTEQAIEIEITEDDYREAVRKSSSGLRRHFIQFFHEVVSRKTGRPCEFTNPRPEIFLSSPEQRTAPVAGGYWVMFAGGKTDMTIKHWDTARYQQVVQKLAGYGINIVQTGARHDVHPPLVGVLNLVGWGKVRELFRLIYHSEGVICPVTSGMHIAAAFRKPCVVIAGGREDPWWEEYSDRFGNFPQKVEVSHVYLDTLGRFPCCSIKGCWHKQVSECETLVTNQDRPLPACMDAVSVDAVTAGVLSYYPSGVPGRATGPLVDQTSQPVRSGCQNGRCSMPRPLSKGEREELALAIEPILARMRDGNGLERLQEATERPLASEEVSEGQ